ncbi:sialate O-acetylesterase [Planctomycetales bacterium ZRK34]|nr:sialate O-acetylesterase [Planctomycetales bacterium ZRK34]
MMNMLAALVIVAGLFVGLVQADEIALPDKSKVHVYLLMGQSNMAGRGPLIEGDRDDVDGVIMLDKSDHWTPAHHPIHFDKPKIAAFGLALPFAKQMKQQAGDGVVIALVPCAFGGTPLSRWVKGGDLYENAVRRAKIAARDGVIMGMIWHQGEADSGSPRNETYGSRITGMIASLRDDLHTPKLPVVVGELGYFFVNKSKGAAKVNEALNDLHNHVAHTACASAEGLGHKGDTTHFDREALVKFGHRYAEAMIKLQHK